MNLDEDSNSKGIPNKYVEVTLLRQVANASNDTVWSQKGLAGVRDGLVL